MPVSAMSASQMWVGWKMLTFYWNAHTSITYMHLYQWMVRGIFPMPVCLSVDRVDNLSYVCSFSQCFLRLWVRMSEHGCRRESTWKRGKNYHFMLRIMNRSRIFSFSVCFFFDEKSIKFIPFPDRSTFFVLLYSTSKIAFTHSKRFRILLLLHRFIYFHFRIFCLSIIVYVFACVWARVFLLSCKENQFDLKIILYCEL